MASQAQVFNMWLVLLGIANVLFTLVVALLGFRVMSAEMFGLGDIELRSMLPQIGLIYLLMNVSIFAIDLIISLKQCNHFSNIRWVSGHRYLEIPHCHRRTRQRTTSCDTFSFYCVYGVGVYVGRLLPGANYHLVPGGSVSPIVVLLWLLPGFRDFVSNLMRTYLVVVFVLVVHVVILMLGATLLNSELTGPTGTPNPLADLIYWDGDHRHTTFDAKILGSDVDYQLRRKFRAKHG